MSDNPILAALALLNTKMDGGFQRLEAGQTAMSERLKAIDDRLSAVEAGQIAMSERLIEVDDRLSAVEAGQTAMSERLTAVDDRLSAVEAGQTSMRTEMAAFRSGVMEELGATRGAVMERMDRLQNAITDIHADIAVNFGAVDHARRLNENTRDEMRALANTVAGMMTMILRLQNEVAELKGKPDGRSV